MHNNNENIIDFDSFHHFLDELIPDYENFKKLKEELLYKFSKEFAITRINETSLKLFEQATQYYYPILGDSSDYGSSSMWYLSIIKSLQTGERFIMQNNNMGGIIPVLWNINNEDYIGLTYNRPLSELLIAFGNVKSMSKTPWDKKISEFIKWLKNLTKWEIKSNEMNTREYDGLFTLQLFYISIKNIDKYFYIIRLHIGSDYRGGYSDPVIYEGINIDEGIPMILKSYEDIYFYCSKCDKKYDFYEDKKKIYWDINSLRWRCGNRNSLNSNLNPNQFKDLCNEMLDIELY